MNEELNAPHNLDAEEGLIACCCLADGADGYDQISHTIDSSDFYLQRNQILFGALASVASRGEDVNEISLAEELKKSSLLEDVGGVPGIMSVMDRVETSTSIKYFAEIVKQKSQLRQIARTCRLAAESALSETVDADIIRTNLESSMISLAEDDTESKDLSSSVEVLREEYRQMMAREYESDVVKTHIDHLDSKLGNGGLAPGEVMVLAAPTSCGKSQLALNIALRAAINSKVSSAIVSLEMPQKQVTALDQIQDLNIKSIHNVKSVQDMASQVRTMVRKDDIKMLIVDYLQLIPFGNGRMSKNDAIADVSHKIKQLALELNIPVILLCQVGREGAKRPGGLMLYDLKDSGDIENDADIVLLMWPKEGDIESSKTLDNHGPYIEMMYNVAKNREGERDVKGIFKFRSSIGRFY
jgi:replicative DNA helicase